MRSAQRSTTLRTCSTPRLASDSPCSGEKSTTSHAPTAGTTSRPAARGVAEVDRCARRERGPAIREPAHVVRIGRLEAADAERAAVAGKVRDATGGGRRC